MLSRDHVESTFANLLPVGTGSLPLTPQIGSKALSDEESEMRLAEAEGILHYSLPPFGSALRSLPRCTEESLLPHRR